MLTKRQQQAIATKEKIIAKSMELYKAHGYENVKISDICKNCDISIGCFYHHFSSKEDTINEVYADFDIHLNEFLEGMTFASSTEAILFIIEQELKFSQKGGILIAQMIFQSQLTTMKRQIIEEDRNIFINIIHYLKTGVESNEFSKNIDLNETARWILRTSRGVIYDWCLHSGTYNLLETGLHDTSVMLNFIKS